VFFLSVSNYDIVVSKTAQDLWKDFSGKLQNGRSIRNEFSCVNASLHLQSYELAGFFFVSNSFSLRLQILGFESLNSFSEAWFWHAFKTQSLSTYFLLSHLLKCTTWESQINQSIKR